MRELQALCNVAGGPLCACILLSGTVNGLAVQCDWPRLAAARVLSSEGVVISAKPAPMPMPTRTHSGSLVGTRCPANNKDPSACWRENKADRAEEATEHAQRSAAATARSQ
jgi:hypothetical protein